MSAQARCVFAWLLLSAAVSTMAQVSVREPSPPLKSAFSSDQSDLWWSPTEAGWGMQLVQTADAIFATLFIYDSGGQPTFLTATLAPTGPLAWSGDLYRTTGSWFAAAPFDPSSVITRKVGSLSFTRSGAELARLQYSVDGIVVIKTVQRELLRLDDFNGVYSAILDLKASGCPAPADNVEQVEPASIAIAQTGTQMTLMWMRSSGTCSFAGSYSQAGHMGELDASFSCSTGQSGSMSFSEMNNRPGMIAGKFQGHSINTGCDYVGSFTGLRPL